MASKQEVSRKIIIRAIENKQMVFAERLTNSKSLVYVMLPNNEVIKAIIHKPTSKVITILPWKDVFLYTMEINIKSIKTPNKFKVVLYPDCYLETGCKTALTNINRFHVDGAREFISFKHYLFDDVFNAAWEEWLKIKKESKLTSSSK